MFKKEWVYREILYQTLERKNNFLTQKSISEKCGVSLGNVNHTLNVLESIGSIEKKPRGFRVIDPKKILIYWASIRNLDKDIIYKTSSDKSVIELEKEMPKVTFTAYSDFKFRFGSIPSDYSEIFVYGNKEKIKERFPEKDGRPKIIVLKSDSHLEKFNKIPISQLFVDLWNINSWYSREFLKILEVKINGILE